MTRNLPISAVLSACLALQFATLTASAFGAGSLGSVGGITRDAISGVPLPEAQIVAHNVNNNTDRSVVSGTNGFFAIDNLEPGRYQLVASKEGFRSFSADVEVAALRTARIDLGLALSDAVPVPTDAPSSADTGSLLVAKELEADWRQ